MRFWRHQLANSLKSSKNQLIKQRAQISGLWSALGLRGSALLDEPATGVQRKKLYRAKLPAEDDLLSFRGCGMQVGAKLDCVWLHRPEWRVFCAAQRNCGAPQKAKGVMLSARSTVDPINGSPLSFDGSLFSKLVIRLLFQILTAITVE